MMQKFKISSFSVLKGDVRESDRNRRDRLYIEYVLWPFRIKPAEFTQFRAEYAFYTRLGLRKFLTLRLGTLWCPGVCHVHTSESARAAVTNHELGLSKKEPREALKALQVQTFESIISRLVYASENLILDSVISCLAQYVLLKFSSIFIS